MADNSHLLLIDGLNTLRRYYEAIPVPDSPEKAQGAIKTTLSAFKKLIALKQPSHVLVAMDSGGKTWRHILSPSYKQSRKPMAEPLFNAKQLFMDTLAEAGIKSLMLPNVEADDLIGTAALCWISKKPNCAITISSNDTDFAQLINQGIMLYNPFKSEVGDGDWVQKTYGVAASQILDCFALVGDSSDDIAGVAGVGVKTAAKWLNLYGSLDNLLANSHLIPGKAGESLRASFEQVLLARELIRLRTNLSLGVTWNDLKRA